MRKETANPIKEVIADCLEVVLDSNLDDSPLREIPALGSVLKLYNAGISIRDGIFYKKLVLFLENIDSMGDEERLAFWSKYENDEKAKKKLGEQLIVYIDRYDAIDKPILLARAVNALQKGLISYIEMLDIAILITSIKTHYIDEVAQIIYRLSDLSFGNLFEQESELPLIYSMEKDGLLMIESEIKMRLVSGEDERQAKVEKTYIATKLAINFIEYIIYDSFEKVAQTIAELRHNVDGRFITEGYKRRQLILDQRR